MIKLKGIEKSFGQNKVLKGASLKVEPSAIVILQGKNGSGKTTLINIIANRIKKDDGEFYVDSERIDFNSFRYKEKVAFYVGSETLIENLNIVEYLSFVASLYLLPKNKFEDRLKKLLEFFELPKKGLIRNFSKGMKTKAALCATFLPDADYLVLDEPFENVDKETILSLQNYFLCLAQQNKGLLITSHLSFDMKKFPHSGVILENGITINI